MKTTYNHGIFFDEAYLPTSWPTRTKVTNPYNYDAFWMWKSSSKAHTTGSIYTDHMIRFEHDKYNLLAQKHFGCTGQYFSSFSPEKIEAFLCDWLSKKVKLLWIQEHCNQASGYPLWLLGFKEIK